MIHIYCGNGKGKTTSAIGLAIRALGSGMKVHMVQFLKGGETSELAVLSQLENLTLARCDRDYGFTFSMSQNDKALLTKCHNRLLLHAESLVQSNAVDMLILDEFNPTYAKSLLDPTLAERLVYNVPSTVELVLTGRNPDGKFLALADYVSEIQAVKHPYTQGINARKGIEF